MEGSKRPPRIPIRQILILSTCRIAEPIALTSVFPYLPEMIESFNVPKNDVAKWAGIVAATFSLAQACTGFLWGRAADRWGRKPTILLAVFSALVSCLLFGFSQNLPCAIVARAMAGGTNGNVGTFRTVVAEMIPEKELQARSFSLMPLVYTMGSIFGPGLGGALANPAARHPSLFGESAFLKRFPYALPNIAAASFLLIGLVTGFLFLKHSESYEETLETKKYERDRGRVLGKLLAGTFVRAWSKILRSSHDETEPLLKKNPSKSGEHDDDAAAAVDLRPNRIRQTPATYKEIFTPQTNWNLISYACLSLHTVAADQLLPIFLHYPQQKDRASDPDVQLPFKFSGGFGLQADRIGLLFTLYGIFGMFIQFFVFPSAARRYGILTCLKVTSVIFPVVTFTIPFTALLPTSAAQQIVLSSILIIRSCVIIFAYPCSAIMLTNSAASVRVLGRLNGVATSFCAIGRAIGPAIGGWAFTLGVDIGYVIVPWWILTAITVLCMIPVSQLVEMEGFAADNVESDSQTDERGPPESSSGNIIADSYERQSQSKPLMDRRDSILSMTQPGSINTVETSSDIFTSSSLQRMRSTTSDSIRRVTSNASEAR